MIISFQASIGQIRQSCPNREPEDVKSTKEKDTMFCDWIKQQLKIFVIPLNIILILCKRLEEETRKNLNIY